MLYLERKLKSLRTINSINYLKRKNLKAKIFLLIGSDNLIYFHKWHKYREILKKCEVLVFSRKGFDKKAKKSIIIKRYRGKNIIFIKNKIDISSSTIRNKYKDLMQVFKLKKIITKNLDENKEKYCVSLKNKSQIADFMIIASGNSSRHLQALSENLLNVLKKNGIINCKIEGKRIVAIGS